jgi:hypothetical protein
MTMNKSINVLVVDDFATMRRIIEAGFKKLGFENYLKLLMVRMY